MPDIEIKRGYEVLPDNNVRFGIKVINNSDYSISDVEVILDYKDSLFNLEGNKLQKIGNIPPNKSYTVEFILKPLGCVHKENIEALVSYRDHTWEKHVVTMRPMEVHCVCPFLKEKKMTKAEFLELSNSGHSVEAGLNFEGVSVEQITDFLVQTCRNRLYKVGDLSIEGGKVLYLSSESIGEKAYYLLTILVKENEGLTWVLFRAVSDKPHGLNGFLAEIVEEFRHLVSTVQSAREIGVIRKKQVINIIDSVVQRTSFGGGEGVSSVNIKDSVVQRTEFNADEERKRLEENWLRKEREHKVVEEQPITVQDEKKGSSRNKILGIALILGGMVALLVLLQAVSITQMPEDRSSMVTEPLQTPTATISKQAPQSSIRGSATTLDGFNVIKLGHQGGDAVTMTSSNTKITVSGGSIIEGMVTLNLPFALQQFEAGEVLYLYNDGGTVRIFDSTVPGIDGSIGRGTINVKFIDIPSQQMIADLDVRF